jgi:iron complex transport system substrate-binding protein
VLLLKQRVSPWCTSILKLRNSTNAISRSSGRCLGQQQRAREINNLYEDRVSTLGETLAGAEKPRVLLLQFNRSDEAYSFRVAPRGWIQTTQVQIGGGDPVWIDEALSPGWNDVQFEQIAAWDPEVIVFVSYRTSATVAVQTIMEDPLWEDVKAVRNGSVYAMPNDFYSWGQPDTRWILGAEWLAYLLHPERFDRPFADRIRAFYSDFYRMDDSQYEREVAPRLSGDLLD